MNNLNYTIQQILFDSLDEAHEEKLTSVLSKKMKPAINELLDKLKKEMKHYDIEGEPVIKENYIKELDSYTINYYLTLPKGLNIQNAKDFASSLNRLLSNTYKEVEKIKNLPFFKKRWFLTFITHTTSGHGPWLIATVKAKDKTNHTPWTQAEIDEEKEKEAFRDLKYLVTYFQFNPNLVLKYSKNAGRISPSIVKNAQTLIKQVQDFINQSEEEIKKLAHASQYDEIKEYYG